jgi:predicted nucleotidyltransferase
LRPHPAKNKALHGSYLAGLFFVDQQMRHNRRMNFQALVGLLQKRLPKLMAVYAFGSRVHDQGHHANADSDLDLAVLVEGYADPVALFELSGEMADLVICPVDLLDLRAASTVMQHQILMEGERLWARDVAAGLFEAAMLTEKLHLDAARQPLIQDVMRRGAVYGR